MNLRKRGQRILPEIPTASMADIAFLLIIFFLVTTTMNQDKGLSLHLPPIAETKEVKEKNICNVWINAQDQIAFYEGGTLNVVASSDLRHNIEQRLAANELLIISLKAERGASYRMFVDVLDELKLSGATRISIAEPEG
ncbi:MAG: biopolymer transporter ExbD [Candidatus Latescibacterota bacterium]|nr:biopolymer transporter ExbD [Candidatus Latescibacterota bacterium]